MNKYKVRRIFQVPTPARMVENVKRFWSTLFSIPGDYLRLLRPWRHGPRFCPPTRLAGMDAGQYHLVVTRAQRDHEFLHLVEEIDRQNFREKITAKWQICAILSPPWFLLGWFPMAVYNNYLETEYPYILLRLDLGRTILRFLFQ